MARAGKPVKAWPAWVEWSISLLMRRFGLVVPAVAPDMGAIVRPLGVDFRVWAPHADSVYVTGTFNNWSKWRTPLASEGNGLWSATVFNAEAGDQYKYVIRRGSETLMRGDPYSRCVTQPHHNSVVVPVNAAPDVTGFSIPPLNELVIYELRVGAFRDSDSQDAGDFQGVIAKLPYLAELGVNAIELMPVAEFPGPRSWGYNPSHPFAVSRLYGGREALLGLIEAAHRAGIAVLIDVVYNHFGPQDLDLWRFDGWYENDLGGIYFYNDWRSATPWGHTRPDYGRPEVQQYLADNARMWLEELGADGLRWDATSYIRTAHGFDGDNGSAIADGWALLRRVNDELNAAFPGRIFIAEDMQGNSTLTLPTEHGGAGFQAQWDAGFVHAIRQAVIGARDETRSMAAVRDALAFRYNGSAFDRVVYTESHDEVANGKARVPEEITPGQADSYFAKKRSTLGAAIVLTAPGIPMIFQGQEFLTGGWFDDRVPLDWERAVAHSGIYRLYRDLIRLRRNLGGRTRGLAGHHIKVFHANETDKMIAYHRWDAGGPRDDVVAVANFSNRARPAYTIGFPRSGVWRVRLNSDLRQYAAEFSNVRCPDVVAAAPPGQTGADGMPAWGNIAIGPYSVLILSQD